MPPAAGRHPAQVREHLIELLTPVVAAIGYDLDDVEVTPAGRRSLVRVTVDGDGGVDLDAIAEISRAVSDALDVDQPGGPAFAGPYVLEVSSPGVDRPLREPRHWRRAKGRLVSVPIGASTVVGRVVAVSEREVTLDVDGARRDVPFADLGVGRMQVEFTHTGGEDGDTVQDDAVDDDVVDGRGDAYDEQEG